MHVFLFKKKISSPKNKFFSQHIHNFIAFFADGRVPGPIQRKGDSPRGQRAHARPQARQARGAHPPRPQLLPGPGARKGPRGHQRGQRHVGPQPGPAAPRPLAPLHRRIRGQLQAAECGRGRERGAPLPGPPGAEDAAGAKDAARGRAGLPDGQFDAAGESGRGQCGGGRGARPQRDSYFQSADGRDAPSGRAPLPLRLQQWQERELV